jgi:cysteine synthase
VKRHRYDSIVEGIGLDRITNNFQHGLQYIDSAVHVTDQEAIDIAHYILQLEGLLIGSSTAINLVATIRTALTLPIHSVIVTIVCDSGYRHLTRFWNEQFITSSTVNLIWPPSSQSPEGYRIPQCLSSILTR